jgi:uncharacterized iron-regulated membrane protein
MGFTGFWYLVQGILWHNGIDIWPHEDPMKLGSVPVTESLAPTPVTLSDAMESALAAVPELRPASINLPEHNRDYYTFSGYGDSFFFDRYSYQVKVNPWSGEVSAIRTPSTMNFVQTMSHLADPLHYGTLLGPWTKAIWFIFGLILSGMSISGFMIYSKRTVKAGRSKKPVRETPSNIAPGVSEPVEGVQ